MRTLSICFLLFAFGCASGAETPSDALVPCDASTNGGRGSYLCGTCATDGLLIPTCRNGVLFCDQSVLVQCACGAAGLGTACCDRCGHATTTKQCNASTGAWECPEGTFECSSAPCEDAGHD